jgi:hypothetical protein
LILDRHIKGDDCQSLISNSGRRQSPNFERTMQEKPKLASRTLTAANSAPKQSQKPQFLYLENQKRLGVSGFHHVLLCQQTRVGGRREGRRRDPTCDEKREVQRRGRKERRRSRGNARSVAGERRAEGAVSGVGRRSWRPSRRKDPERLIPRSERAGGGMASAGPFCCCCCCRSSELGSP